MLRLAIGVFLIAHGLIHAAIWLPQAASRSVRASGTAPFDPGYSWLFSGVGEDAARWLAALLAIAAAVLYVSGGIGLFAHLEWWRGATITASVASLVLFALYFNPWLSLAVLIDVALVWALVWARWPPVAQVGA
jgi:hypothetical protein